MTNWSAFEGTPAPLGVVYVESAQAYNFALYSKNAESVTLFFYTDADLVTPARTYPLDYLKNKSGRVWHCRIPSADVRGVRYYAYVITGPEPQSGFERHAFDADKILLDPYAKSVYFPPTFDRTAAMRPGSNAGKAPLGLLVADGEAFDWSGEKRPRHEGDTVLYELHVRGYTSNPNSGVSPVGAGPMQG